MPPRQRQPLDQARDKMARYFCQTAGEYASYLEGEYHSNYKERRTYWDRHYAYMRDAFARCLMLGIEDGNLPRRSEMNMAMVGPGMHPLGRDLDRDRIHDYMAELHSLVVIDFSAQVVRSAVESLVLGGMPSERMHPMQYDVTDGMSTVYETYIAEKLRGIKTEEEFSRITETLARFDMSELRGRLHDEFKRRGGILHAPPMEDLFEGGVNERRTLKLSTGGEPLPLHMMYLPMVTAGTGAAAEARVWETYDDVTGQTDRARGEEPTEALNREREAMFRRIHTMIARYNTEVTYNLLWHVFDCNPDITVLAATDVDTVHINPDFDAMPRLLVEELRARMDKDGIRMRTRGTWRWEDEPEHLHDVNALVFRRHTAVVQPQVRDEHTALVAVSSQQGPDNPDAPKMVA